ncbi:MAG: thermopsin family protease [Thermoproteus sp.]
MRKPRCAELVLFFVLLAASSVAGYSVLGLNVVQPEPSMFTYLNPLNLSLVQISAGFGANYSYAYFSLLKPGYFLPVTLNLTGLSTSYVEVYAWSSGPVQIYIMDSGQYLAFSKGGSARYLAEAYGGEVYLSEELPAGRVYYVVAYNNSTDEPALVFLAVSASPKPEGPAVAVGAADYGIGLAGGRLVAYSYSTDMFVGRVAVYGADTEEPGYCPTLSAEPGSRWFSVQLNVVMEVRTADGGTQYYWLQDIASYDSSKGTVEIWDNIWNDTESSAALSPGLIAGSGRVAGGVFYSASGLWPPQPAPRQIYLVVKSGISAEGLPWAAFGYSLDGAHITWYDNVTIGVPATYARLVVEPPGYPLADAELVVSGPWRSECTYVRSMSADLALYFKHGDYLVPVPFVWSFGIHTAEAALGANATAVGPGEVYVSAGLERPAFLRTAFALLTIYDPLAGGANASLEAPGYVLNLTRPRYVYLTNGTRYVLLGYSVNGTLASNGTELSVALHGSTEIRVLWERQYLVSVESPAPIYVNGTEAENLTEWVGEGSVLEVLAPEVLYLGNGTRLAFSGISVDGAAYRGNVTLAVSSPLRIEASYAKQYLVAVRSPAPVVVNGINATELSLWVDAGSSLDIEIPRYVYLGNGTRLAALNGSEVLTVERPLNLTVAFERQYLVQIYSEAPVYIDGAPALNFSQWVPAGAVLNLTIPRYVYTGNGSRLASLNSSSAVAVVGPIVAKIYWVPQYLVIISSPIPIYVNGTAATRYTAWLNESDIVVVRIPQVYYFGNGTRAVATNSTELSLAVRGPVNAAAVWSLQYLVRIHSEYPVAVNGSEQTNYTAWLAPGAIVAVAPAEVFRGVFLKEPGYIVPVDGPLDLEVRWSVDWLLTSAAYGVPAGVVTYAIGRRRRRAVI